MVVTELDWTGEHALLVYMLCHLETVKVFIKLMLMIIACRSLDIWKSSIDAKHNWWGFNETLAVSGRIRDRSDESDLLEVDFQPFLHSNKSILDDKCPPGWKLFTDTCFIYIGAPMTFQEARAFCEVCTRNQVPHRTPREYSVLLYLHSVFSLGQ